MEWQRTSADQWYFGLEAGEVWSVGTVAGVVLSVTADDILTPLQIEWNCSLIRQQATLQGFRFATHIALIKAHAQMVCWKMLSTGTKTAHCSRHVKNQVVRNSCKWFSDLLRIKFVRRQIGIDTRISYIDIIKGIMTMGSHIWTPRVHALFDSGIFIMLQTHENSEIQEKHFYLHSS